MTIQSQVLTSVIYAAEGTFGTRATAGGTSKVLRRVTTSLNLGKDIYQSNEARADLQLADARHGTKRPGGSVDGELTNIAYDDFIEALLRGTWTNGTTSLPADWTTIAGAVTSGTALVSGSLGTMTWTAGDPVAKGFRIGDVIRPVGTPGGTNDTTNFRIVGFSGTSNRIVAVTPAPAAFAATALTSWNAPGKKVMNGTVRRSFTIEQLYALAGVSELFSGMRLGSGAFNIPPNAMATCSFGFMGQDMAVLDSGTTPVSPYFSAATAAGTNKLVAGPSGSIRLAGVEQGIVTGLQLTVDNNLQADPVVGNVLVPDVFEGQQRYTGTVSYFLQDKSLLNVFVNETEVDLTAVLYTTQASLPDFLAFNLQRVKTTGITKSVAAQGGVVVTSPFVGLLATAGVGIDGATLSVQKSL